jgi:hypothetical protein
LFPFARHFLSLFPKFQFLQNRDEKWVYLLNYKKNLCAFAPLRETGCVARVSRKGAKAQTLEDATALRRGVSRWRLQQRRLT